MRKSILLVACLSGCNFSNIQTNIANSSKLEEYRYSTIRRMRKHTDKHPTCFLNKLYGTIETIPIEWFEGDNHSSAYFHNGRIMINKNFYRSNKDATVTIIHELIHAVGICGEDVNKSSIPICYVFDKPVYHSTDITKYIEDHLKEY